MRDGLLGKMGESTRVEMDGSSPAGGAGQDDRLANLTDRQLLELFVRDHDERSLTGVVAPVPDAAAVVGELVARVSGFGPLQAFLDDPAVEEVWINDPRHRLAEGMAVNAQLLVRRAERRVFIPTSALFAREGERFAYRIEGAEVKAQAVDTGAEQGDETEVLKGLRAGDRVVRDGSLSLADGAKVTYPGAPPAEEKKPEEKKAGEKKPAEKD